VSTQTFRQTVNSMRAHISGIGRRLTLWAVTLGLIVTLSAGMPGSAVRALDTTTAYEVNHAYVHYSADHVPVSTGDLTDISGATTIDQEGHTYDLYGNLLSFNADNSITDVNSQVVGFVYRVTDAP